MNFGVSAANWEEVSEKIKKKITQKTEKLSRNVKNKIGKTNPSIKAKLLFNIMRKMQQSNTWNMVDKGHWQKNNWLEAKRPWK